MSFPKTDKMGQINIRLIYHRSIKSGFRSMPQFQKYIYNLWKREIEELLSHSLYDEQGNEYRDAYITEMYVMRTKRKDRGKYSHIGL